MEIILILDINAEAAAQVIEKNTVTGFDWYTWLKKNHPKSKDVKFKSMIYTDDKSFRMTRHHREFDKFLGCINEKSVRFEILLRHQNYPIKNNLALKGKIIPVDGNKCKVVAKIGFPRQLLTLAYIFLLVPILMIIMHSFPYNLLWVLFTVMLWAGMKYLPKLWWYKTDKKLVDFLNKILSPYIIDDKDKSF